MKNISSAESSYPKLNTIGNYWDTRSEGYRQQIENEHRDGTEEFYENLFKDIPAGSKVLDIGCGPGFFCGLLTRLGHEVTAVDYSPKMLEQAKDYVASVTENPIKFLRGNAQNLPFDDESFDLIVSRNLVWNLEDPEKAYNHWHRLLKKGGDMFVFDGNHYCYLFDEDYAKLQTPQKRDENHIFLGVSTTIIDTLAEELPLSKLYRPEWDEKVLSKIGFREIESHPVKSSTTPEGKTLPLSFFVKCSK